VREIFGVPAIEKKRGKKGGGTRPTTNVLKGKSRKTDVRRQRGRKRRTPFSPEKKGKGFGHKNAKEKKRGEELAYSHCPIEFISPS